MRVDMRVLLGSGGIGTEKRTARFKGLLTEHFEGCGRILFIPLATANHQDRVIMVGQATLLPALTPTYGMPLLTDSLIALTIPSL